MYELETMFGHLLDDFCTSGTCTFETFTIATTGYFLNKQIEAMLVRKSAPVRVPSTNYNTHTYMLSSIHLGDYPRDSEY